MTEDTIAYALRDAIRVRLRDGRQYTNRRDPMTTNQLAKTLGVSHSYISMLVNGRAKSLTMLFLLASVVGVQVVVKIDGEPVVTDADHSASL